jgi:hypothetical protein
MTSVYGELKGNELSAQCDVRKDANGAVYIENVRPPLPKGEYQLIVNGLSHRAQYANGHWRKIDC